jgi:hypothetical protein
MLNLFLFKKFFPLLTRFILGLAILAGLLLFLATILSQTGCGEPDPASLAARLEPKRPTTEQKTAAYKQHNRDTTKALHGLSGVFAYKVQPAPALKRMESQ